MPTARGYRGSARLRSGANQPGGVETRLQPRKLLVERAQSRQPHRLDVELEFAARLVDRRGGPHFDLLAVLEREIGELGLVPEEDAAHLRLGVLEIEVAVAGRRADEVRDLPRHPDEAQVALDDAVAPS